MLVLLPVYWLLMSLASYRALIQLVLRPHKWEKTPHRGRQAAAEVKLERVKGIEPSYAAWEAAVLPLNYTRLRPGDIRPQAAKGNRRPRAAAALLLRARLAGMLSGA